MSVDAGQGVDLGNALFTHQVKSVNCHVDLLKCKSECHCNKVSGRFQWRRARLTYIAYRVYLPRIHIILRESHLVKISRIETFTYWIEWCNWLFVRVSTDEGLYGWGEGSLHGAIRSVETAIHELEPVLIGQDPSGAERHWQAMYHAWRWRGGPTLFSAMGALDMALWDLEGKRLGVPVYRLLGGPLRTRLRGYASHWLHDASTPQQAFDGAREALRRGFTGFKWSPFHPAKLRENESSAIARAAEMMAAAREGAGPDTEILSSVGSASRRGQRPSPLIVFSPTARAGSRSPSPSRTHGLWRACRKRCPCRLPLASGCSRAGSSAS